jgi:hypothetical protein
MICKVLIPVVLNAYSYTRILMNSCMSLVVNYVDCKGALTVVCDNQDCYVLGFAHRFVFLKSRDRNISETGSASVLR